MPHPRLYEFLLARFDTGELSRMASLELPGIRDDLPALTVSPATYTSAFVDALERRGLINDALFDLLQAKRSRFPQEIAELRAEARSVAPVPKASPAKKSKLVVTFLAANPRTTPQLALEAEKSRIDDVLHDSAHGTRALLQAFWSVTLANLAEVLRRYKPAILHFSGHGADGGGLLLEGVDRGAQPLDGEAFGQWLLSLPERPRMIVLNACHSAHNAVPLTRCVDIVVGMSNEVQDDAAALFAETFYAGLGEGQSVHAAFRAAKRAVRAAFPGQEVLLQLNFREGVDPDEIFLFAA